MTDPGTLQVNSISPTVGATAGGTTISIYGWNMSGVTGVTVGGVAATAVTLVNNAMMTAVIPAGSSGYSDIVVTGSNGTATMPGAFHYSNLLIDSSLIAYLDPQNTNIFDSKGASDTGNYWYSETSRLPNVLNNFTLPSNSASGWDGNGTVASPYRLKFDGSNDYVNMGNLTVKSFAVWFNASTIDSNQRNIFMDGNLDSYVSGGVLYVRYNGLTYHTVGIGTNTWYHLVVSNDGSTTTFYLNDQVIGSEASGSQAARQMYLGSLGGFTYWFAGSIGSVRAYSRNLSTSEVRSLYTQERILYATDPGVPKIMSIAPAVGLATGGTTIAIYGWDLGAVNSVTVGGVAATSVTVVGADKVTAVTPAGSGYANVVVSDGTHSDTKTAAFRYTNTASDSLIAWYDAGDIDNMGAKGNAVTTPVWASLAGPMGAGLNNFTLPTAGSNSGWDVVSTSPQQYVLKFNGTNNYVNAGNMAVGTVSTWVYPTTIDTNNPRYIFSDGTCDAYVQSGAIYMRYNSSAWQSTTASANTWYHVVITNDGTTSKYYVNNSLIGTTSDAAQGVRNMVVGAITWLNYYFSGYVSQARFYTRALTASEVSAIYTTENAWYAPLN